MQKQLTPKIMLWGAVIVVIIYLVLIGVSSFYVARMNNITYEATAFGRVLQSYEFDFDEKIAKKITYDFDGNQVSSQEVKLSNLEMLKVKVQLALAFVPFWQASYEDPTIMDGDQWDMIRTYNEKEQVTYGSNAYPYGYRSVLKVMESVFKKSN